MVYTRDAKVGQEIVLPEALGAFTLTEIRHDAQFRGHPVGDAFIGRLVPANGPAEEIVLPIRFPTFDRMRRGEVIVAVDRFKQRHYTGLQVNQDPGVDVVYAGFILMIVGCFVTFFTSHRQVCVEAVRRGSGTEVTVTGKANKNKTGVARLVGRLSESLKALR